MSVDTLVLTTTDGAIKGIKRKSLYAQTYFSFERIPYARPPLGSLRFKAPQKADKWANVLDCTDFGNKPLQRNFYNGELEGDENCLYLNVYVKQFETTAPLPVMIFIYGGAFQNGGATREELGPDYFMLENVILVTINYRLGPLGFLSLNDAALEVPGNAGLKDQIAGLKWFKANCSQFNGDPNNITVFGNSAGGASTHYLTLTAQAKGLFHKAILMSGTAFNTWACVPKGDYAYRLAKHNGYVGENIDASVLSYLLTVDGGKLMGLELRTDEERLNDVSLIFGPTVESYVGADCVIPTAPLEMIKTAWGNDIPMMIGGTSFEGLLLYARVKASPQILRIYKQRPELVVTGEVRQQRSLEECKVLGLKILSLYADEENNFELMKYLEFVSHKNFWHGFQRSLLARLESNTIAPTYLYRFDFDSATFNFHRLKYCGTEVRGVSHADELSYLFLGKQGWKLDKTTAEYKTIECMVSIWTKFAQDSNPNCASTTEAGNWLPVAIEQPNRCLNISNELQLMALPETEILDTWNKLYKKLF